MSPQVSGVTGPTVSGAVPWRTDLVSLLNPYPCHGSGANTPMTRMRRMEGIPKTSTCPPWPPDANMSASSYFPGGT